MPNAEQMRVLRSALGPLPICAVTAGRGPAQAQGVIVFRIQVGVAYL